MIKSSGWSIARFRVNRVRIAAPLEGHSSSDVVAQLVAAEQFEVVVSDLGLPDGTGYDLMKQISHRLGIKGIALSGYGMEEDQRRSREAGFIEHVVKPVDVRKLLATIERITGGS